MGEAKYRQIIQEMFDTHPEEDPLLEFDEFLVGGTMRQDVPAYIAAQRSLTWQLSGVRDVETLRRGEVESEEIIAVEDDLDEFVSEQLEILDEEQYEKLFLAMKIRAFNLYHFLDIKSAALGDIPVKEKDLVLDEDDYYILDYLKQAVTDYHAVASVATLTACENMGIYAVRFRERDGCPVCRALDGNIYETRMLIGLIAGGNHVSHPYCDCHWEPVIWRELYGGPLEGYLDVDEVTHRGKKLVNVPVELEIEIRDLSEKIAFDRIEFVDMKDHLRENLEIEDLEGIVAVVEDDVLFIHHSYVGSHGPADFLREFARIKALPAKISVANLENAEVYLLGGRRVAKWDGRYWDPVTGELLK